jgi:phage baseplate assembly protein W
VQGEGANRSFWIEGRRIARTSELGGASDVDALRERIHRALTTARGSHPMADYFK